MLEKLMPIMHRGSTRESATAMRVASLALCTTKLGSICGVTRFGIGSLAFPQNQY